MMACERVAMVVFVGLVGLVEVVVDGLAIFEVSDDILEFLELFMV